MKEVQNQKAFHLSFSQALDAIKKGYSVSRDKWKEKEFLYMGKGSVPNDINDIYYRYDMDFYVIGDDGTTVRLPNLIYINSDNCTVNGWSPSQEDMFIHDWYILPNF